MPDITDRTLLDRLAEVAGIAPEYYDIEGRRHETSPKSKQAILTAMGFNIESDQALNAEWARWEARMWQTVSAAALVVRTDETAPCWIVTLPCSSGEEGSLVVSWRIRLESGAEILLGQAGPGLPVVEAHVMEERRYVRCPVRLPTGLPIGYHELYAEIITATGRMEAATRLIVAPPTCYVPPALARGGRVWGLSVPLYAVRSNRNWGAGDFGDLRILVERAGATLGADIIGLNPLHALKNRRPYHISPYSPNSRLYLNELYLDVGRLAEGGGSTELTDLLVNEEFSSWLETLRKAELVDYDAVADAKRRAIERAFELFLREHLQVEDGRVSARTALGREFLNFVESEGEPLRLFAVHEVLAEDSQRRVPTIWSWRDWPEVHRSPRSAEVAAIARRRWARVLFFQYVQWQLGRQLGEVQQRATQVGMAIGLYHDLALGSDLNGADGWIYQEALALDAECGAPPDAFAPEGQNWGFAPFDPLRLRGSGYQPYIDLLRHTLRHGGAIRIDHVMGLFRLFWIPKGLSASAGTYVHYPSEDLLAILALESHRARCMVIGEDLGTVPDWVREQLARVNVLSYKVFYFERTWDGTWKPPQWYPPMSVAVVTTHDLATLSGFWLGEDLAVRAKLGLLPDAQARNQAEEARQRDKKLILQAIEKEGLLPAGLSPDPAAVPTMTSELAKAIHAYLAKTPAWVMLANLDDLLGEVRQMNVPGTVTEHPNWSRKLPVEMESLWDHPQLKSVVTMLRDIRPRRAALGEEDA